MPTVVDTLIVELELDLKKFTGGQRKAVEEARRAEGEIGKVSRNVEARGRSLGQTFGTLTGKAVGFLAVLAGANSLKSFATNILTADRNTGILAKNLGMAVRDVSAWQGAVKQAGGTAADADASLQSLASTVQQIQLTGTAGQIPFLQQLGITSIGQLKDANGALLTMSDRMRGMDPTRAQALGQGAGLSPGMVTLLIQGRTAVEGYLEAQRQAGVTTEASAKAALELNRQLELAKSGFGDIGREVLVTTLPALMQVLGNVKDLKAEFNTWDLAGVRDDAHDLGAAWNEAGDALGDLGAKWDRFFGKENEKSTITFLDNVRMSLVSLGAILRLVAAAARGDWADVKRQAGLVMTGGGDPTPAGGGGVDTTLPDQRPRGGSAGTPLTPGSAADAAVRTMVTEAAKGDYRGMKDVGHVIRNRMAKDPRTNAADVVKAPGQFEPWMNGRAQAVDPNSPEYQAAYKAWLEVEAERRAGVDPTGGATLFYSKGGQAAMGRKNPAWDIPANRTLERGGHVYLKGAFNRVVPGSGGAGGATTVTTNVGTINVQTQATDVPGIAKGIGQSLADYNYVAQANTGLQ